MISLIVAMDSNRVIGLNNQLPWHLPDDLKHFRKTTEGKPVIMGRSTFESIGKPLPKRTNIVLSRDLAFKKEGIIVVSTLDDAIKAAQTSAIIVPEMMVIGGSQIFSQFLPKASRMYVTWVKQPYPGDAFFPKFAKEEWRVTEESEHPDFIIQILDKEVL